MSIPKKLGRVRSRIKGAFGGIPDTSTSSLPIVEPTSSSVNLTPIVSVQAYLGPGIEIQNDRTRFPSIIPGVQPTLPDINHALDPSNAGARSAGHPFDTNAVFGAQAASPSGDPVTSQTPSTWNTRLTTPTIEAFPGFDKPCGTSSSAQVGPGLTKGTWKYLNDFMRVLCTVSGFAPLKSVMEEFRWVTSLYDEEAEVRSQYVALRRELEELFSVLSAHFSDNAAPTMTMGMNNLCTAIERELDHIVTREGRRAERRFMGANRDLNEVIECYRRIRGHLERLKFNANLSIWKVVDEQASEVRLKSLSPSLSAEYNSAQAQQVGRRECTPKTREQVLADLSHWAHSQKQENMYWLNGMAGTGKTTIASSLCAILGRSHQLGASFFCTRLLPECRNVNVIIPTIAYQLARFSRPFYHSLSLALQVDPDLHSKALSNQLLGLIVDPLRNVAHSLPEDLVVVIDALDECEDSQGVGLLLEIMAKHASKLPIKIFVSSRPEPQIRNKLGDTKSKLILHELEASVVKQDIALYLHMELKNSGVSISDVELQTIVRHSGVLFIYAATVARYIQAADEAVYQQERIQEVLGTTSYDLDKYQDIDSLYDIIIRAAFNNKGLRKSEKANLKLVLDTVVCAQEPISVKALAGFLQLGDEGRIRAALKPLWSVVHIHGAHELVTTLHASFPDYMLDPTRSGANGCQGGEHHGRLADLCFNRIESNECQFNICGLASSFMLDEEVSNLSKRIEFAVPQDLWYACRYWAFHLTLGAPSTERLHKTNEIVSTRLLLWIEVLNLKKQIHIAAPMLEMVGSWCQGGGAPRESRTQVHDAWRFVTMFATNDVSRSTPHLYMSMLASWPGPGPLVCRDKEIFTGLPKVEGAGTTRRQLALLGSLNAGGRVNSVAFSLDGLYIASGSSDNVVQVWDAHTGKPLFDQLKGHTKAVNSVAFSPNGMHIVSGSSDNTIRVWDTQTGEPSFNPLKGHTDWVQSVAFSPDGMYIVSGSDDDTVRVWNAQLGGPQFDPFKGHVRSVRSVTFSFDGTRIASASGDRTIRVWNAQTGGLLLGPLVGHTGSVKSVAFSPCGGRIISGSDDRTIRVLDAQTGELLLDSLEGHKKSVRSVAFSSDSKYIVSGSSDNTVLVWDAQTGKVLLDPLKGHTSSVTSVTFSPSCMRILSGSHDGTIRMWDARIDKRLPDPLQGHTGWINSLAYSFDNTRVVSGSSDKTLQIWDARTGEPLLHPLRGHTSSIMSVAFSPDGSCIASGSDDRTIRLWDAQTGKSCLNQIIGHTEVVNSVAFSSDGLRIVSGSDDATVQVWDAHTGRALLGPLKGHTSSVKSVVFSPKGTCIVSGSDDSTLRLWDAQTGEPLHDPLRGHTNWVTSVAFSPDALQIVSGSGDRTIRVWDSQTGEIRLGPIKGHTDWVRTVAFSPDGTFIVSGSDDMTVRVWNSQTGQPLHGPLRGHTNWVTSVAFSPNGTRIVSGSRDNVIRMWNANRIVDHPTTRKRLPYSRWTLDEGGWVRDERQRPLVWLPPDLRDRLVLPDMEYLISTEGSVLLDFESAKLGESWTECHSPCPRI